MPLDHQAQKLLDAVRAAGLPPVRWLPVPQARARNAAAYIIKDPPVEVFRVEDRFIPCAWGKLPIRIYTPEGPGPFPVFIFYHGGGWVLNSVETHDSVCRHLARMSGCLVISVEYRLAPECPFPGPVEDAYEALAWTRDNAASLGGRGDSLGVGGDSAGGNLAAAAALLSRDRGGPKIKSQILIYPITDHIFPGTPSYVRHGDGYTFTSDMMNWFWCLYLSPGENLDNPYICPLRASSFQDLPPALVMTAEFDPLHDEGELYARKLAEAGVETTYSEYRGQMHGFLLQWRVLDRGMDALREISREMKKRLFA